MLFVRHAFPSSSSASDAGQANCVSEAAERRFSRFSERAQLIEARCGSRG